MSISIDTNVFVYAFDTSAGRKHARAIDVVRAASNAGAFVPLQVLAEFFAVLTRRSWFSIAEARTIVSTVADRLDVVTPTTNDLMYAMRLAENHAVAFWDAMLICVAARSGCTTFVSDNFQDGRRFAASDVGRELVVVDPFNDANIDLLRAAGVSIES